MKTTCVVVADGARARILVFRPDFDAPGGRTFVEHETLVNPELAVPSHERWSAGRSEARGHIRGHWYGMDDHREKHDADVERRFASEVVETARQLARGIDAKEIIFVADPKMLGFSRPAFVEIEKSGIAVQTHARDISKFSIDEIEGNLAAAGLLPERIAMTR